MLISSETTFLQTFPNRMQRGKDVLELYFVIPEGAQRLSGIQGQEARRGYSDRCWVPGQARVDDTP